MHYTIVDSVFRCLCWHVWEWVKWFVGYIKNSKQTIKILEFILFTFVYNKRKLFIDETFHLCYIQCGTSSFSCSTTAKRWNDVDGTM